MNQKTIILKKVLRLFNAILFSCLTLSIPAMAQPKVEFDVELNPAGDFTARTTSVKGFAVKLSDKEVEARNISVDLKTLDTGIGLRNEHTLKHLDAKNHPEAILVKAKGKNGQGIGILKIKGIEKKIKGIYKINNNELHAEFKIQLEDYDIKNISYKGIGVSNEVKLRVSVPLQVASPPSNKPTKK